MSIAFITGSRAYGTPREDSDTDLVVSMSQECVDKLSILSDLRGSEIPGSHCRSLKFGKLNLLCCTSDEARKVWWNGTAELQIRESSEHRKVTREEAVTLFTKLRVEAGLQQ